MAKAFKALGNLDLKRQTCERTGKMQYATESDARLMAGFIPAKYPKNRNSTTLRAYLCPFCKTYHLTHKPLRVSGKENL